MIAILIKNLNRVLRVCDPFINPPPPPAPTSPQSDLVASDDTEGVVAPCGHGRDQSAVVLRDVGRDVAPLVRLEGRVELDNEVEDGSKVLLARLPPDLRLPVGVQAPHLARIIKMNSYAI